MYKVFDATQTSDGKSMNYTIMSNKNGVLPTVTYPDDYDGAQPKYYKDSAGNVYFGTVSDTQNETYTTAVLDGNKTMYLHPISEELNGVQASAVNSAVATYVGSADPVADVDVTSNFTNLEITGLAYGYYYVTTSTGALVALNSTNQSETVGDKNTVPSVKKTIESVDNGETDESQETKGTTDTDKKNAIAEAGSTVHFQSVITVGKGAKNYVFHDEMSKGLTLKTNSIVVKKGETTATATTDYTQTITEATGNNGDSFTIDFTNTYEAGLNPGDTITITYTATVNSDALHTNPEKNTVYVDYGNNNQTTKDEVNVYNATLTIKKVDGDNKPLEGAKFRLYKLNGNTKLYYHETTNAETGAKSISWIADSETDPKPDEVEATKVADDYVATFAGLTNGTYYIEESTVPSGYNKAADKEIVINAANIENAVSNATITRTDTTITGRNLEPVTTIQNKTGSLLPSTGGIGTTIFYVIGGVLIAGAAILLITRRKKA